MSAFARVPPLVLAALVMAGCPDTGAPAHVEIEGNGEATGVTFELAGPGGAALMVPVHLNGTGPYGFVLDTGATMTCVDVALSDRLGIPDAAGRGVGVGIGQEPGALRLIAIDSVRVGGAMAAGLTGCALNLEQFREMGLEVEGLLGLNFLQQFRVTLDFERNQLSLERPGPG
jgi:predicted aspartyl protease